MEPWEESGEALLLQRLQPMQDELVRPLHPQNQRKRRFQPLPQKKIACGALENSVFLRGRRCAPARPRPFRTARVPRPPPGVRDPTPATLPIPHRAPLWPH